MDKIQDRSNELTDQVKLLIAKAFPPALDIKVEYFEGEDKDTERLYLVLSIISVPFGNLYLKSKRLAEGETFMDVEHDFVGAILADFIVLGTTFLMNNIMAHKVANTDRADNILKNPFSKGRLKNVNLN